MDEDEDEVEIEDEEHCFFLLKYCIFLLKYCICLTRILYSSYMEIVFVLTGFCICLD